LVLLVYFIRIAYIMSYREQCPADCKVYVGGLPERASRGELEEIFGRFGPLRNVWVARRPWGFAFVEFEDARDAIDAVRQLDGSRMCGVRARVELSHGQRRNRGPRGYDDERRVERLQEEVVQVHIDVHVHHLENVIVPVHKHMLGRV
ncbi:Serine/arginine-rich splicing factor 3, partial [Trichinella pseudospiralis]